MPRQSKPTESLAPSACRLRSRFSHATPPEGGELSSEFTATVASGALEITSVISFFGVSRRREMSTEKLKKNRNEEVINKKG